MSWHTAAAVNNPRVMVGGGGDGFGHTAAGGHRHLPRRRVWHARSGFITRGWPVWPLTPTTSTRPCTTAPVPNWAPCAPRRAVARTCASPASATSPHRCSTRWWPRPFGSDHLGSPSAGDITTAIERTAPLFHLVNGDLCYANLAHDRIRTWSDWFANNSPLRPLPAVDARAPATTRTRLGNGPIGLRRLPDLLRAARHRVGPRAARAVVRVHRRARCGSISLEQRRRVPARTAATPTYADTPAARRRRWLEAELGAARADRRHRLDRRVHAPGRDLARPITFNGADLGHPRGMAAAVRPVRGRPGGVRSRAPLRAHPSGPRARCPTDTPDADPVARRSPTSIDTSKGTVHLVIGGGGTSSPSNKLLLPRAPLPGPDDRRRSDPADRA